MKYEIAKPLLSDVLFFKWFLMNMHQGNNISFAFINKDRTRADRLPVRAEDY